MELTKSNYMAGANYNGGTVATTQGVPRIGGELAAKDSPSGGATTPVAASAHLTDGNRAEGVAYDSNKVGEMLDTGGYPAGTAFPEDDINFNL